MFSCSKFVHAHDAEYAIKTGLKWAIFHRLHIYTLKRKRKQRKEVAEKSSKKAAKLGLEFVLNASVYLLSQ